MSDFQAGIQAFFFARGKFGLSGAALFAMFDKRCQGRVGLCRVHSQRVLRRHSAKRHAHNSIGACGEDIHFAALDQCARRIFDRVQKRKTYTFAFAKPVFLHGAHAIRPTLKAVLCLLKQFSGVIGNTQVIAGDLALFNRCTRAPAASVDDLFVGQYRFVDGIPVHNLRFTIGDTLVEHL